MTMGKEIYSIIYFMIAIAMVIFFFSVHKKDKKESILKTQIVLFLMADIMYIITFYVGNSTYQTFMHGATLVLEMWVSYLFLSFCLEFVKAKRGTRKMVAWAGAVWCAVDSFFVIFYQKSWYPIHLILVLAVYILTAGVLLYKAYSSPSIFKSKYIALGIALLCGLLIGIYMRLRWGLDVQPALYFMTYVECLHVILYFYIPKRKILRMNNFVIDKTTSPVLLFDNEDELQVMNEAARKLLGLELYAKMSDYIRDNNLKYILTEERRKTGKTKEFTLTTTIREATFLIHGQEIYDKHKNFLGTLFLYNDITSQEKLKEEATFHATRDALTGVWNRDFFFEMVEKELYEYPDIEYVMIAADIHRFMMFNEILGKRTGDDLLISIARGFERRCKEHWVIGRISGDRFAMIMPKTDFNEERFLSFSQQVFEERGYSLKVHLYIGVYQIADKTLSADEMYHRTYMAIESIKGNMRETIAYYSDHLREQQLKETITVDEMEKAIKQHEFVVYLQPQVDSRTNKLVGSEALVRWMSPEKGMVAPVEFIPLFESNGMISNLDYYVWEEVCKILRGWKLSGHTERTISVNISAKDFYLTDIYQNLTGLVEKYEIHPQNLKLEITESAFALNATEQAKLVKKFREYGFVVEIDDFGSGYSSLNHLKDIEVDILKLDMKFFDKCENIHRANVIVESMVRLANHLNMLVIAEGVETKEQVQMLQEMGCDIIQGYYYAKPMPVTSFEKFIEEHPYEDLECVNARFSRDMI